MKNLTKTATPNVATIVPEEVRIRSGLSAVEEKDAGRAERPEQRGLGKCDIPKREPRAHPQLETDPSEQRPERNSDQGLKERLEDATDVRPQLLLRKHPEDGGSEPD